MHTNVCLSERRSCRGLRSHIPLQQEDVVVITPQAHVGRQVHIVVVDLRFRKYPHPLAHHSNLRIPMCTVFWTDISSYRCIWYVYCGVQNALDRVGTRQRIVKWRKNNNLVFFVLTCMHTCMLYTLINLSDL